VAAVTSTDVAAIERELTKLEQRRTQLAESLDAAMHNAIDASAVRRESIIDNRDQQTLEEANSKVREAEERRVALDDALRTLDQKIAETTTRFKEAKDKGERDRIAQVLEQEADAVEKASLAVDEAAKQFASAYRQLRGAMSPASCLRTPDRHRLAEDRVAALLAAEALAGAMPDLFIHKPDELGIASVLHRAFPLGDDVVRDVTRNQQQLRASPHWWD
jgi:DNA repair exonuclease SbcCD ATPase subunit